MKKLLMTVACSAIQVSVTFAESYTWINNTDASATWEPAANWDGDVPDPRSTSSGDLSEPVQVDFGTLTTYQKIQGWNLKGQSNKYIHFDKLTSAGAPREIQLNLDGNGVRGITLFLRDISGFNGYFTVDPKGNSSGTSPGAAVYFRATDSYAPHLRYMTGTLPFTYFVPTAGKIQIDNVLGGGRFRLNAADANYQGAVEFTASPGGETSPYLNGGALILHGATTSAETVLARAALHLDATAADTLAFDGQYLDGWTDPVKGITVVPEGSGNYRPTVTNDFANALPAVNFGRFSGVVQYGNNCQTNNGKYATWAGQPARLRLPQSLTGVKELFVVWRDWYRSQNPSYFVGTDVAADNVFHRTQGGNGLFATTAATSQIQQGETRLNGQRVLAGQGINSYANVYVASASVGADCAGGKVEYVGGGMGLFTTEMQNKGGLAIGEIILFTETLTPAERRAVNAYLKQKWLAGRDAADLDLGTLTAVNGTTVEVVEGTSEIAELDMVADATLVKKGAGDLVIGQLTRDNITFDVQEGRVILKRSAKPLEDIDVTTYCPPADAYLWLDATKSDSFEPKESTTVSKWNDVRGGKNEGGAFAYADPTVNKSGGRVGVNATIVEGASPAGLSVFDTGTYGDGTTAAPFTMKVNNSEIGTELQEIFAVAKGPHHIFGGSKLDLSGIAATCILKDSYSSRYAEASVATIDGVTVDPTACVNDQTNFQVFTLAASGGIAWNGLAHDRGDASTAGGCQYGEILVYSRRLTSDERREITSYLMKKWLGKDHPDIVKSRSTAKAVISAGEMAAVSFDAAGEPVVLRKTDVVGPLISASWAHYDATKADHFTYDSGSTTRIRTWYDDNKESGRAMVNGTQDQMPSRSNVVVNAGKSMPVVDFGPAYVSTDKTLACNLKMNSAQINNDTTEIYLIHADTDSDGVTGLFGADRGTVPAEMGKYLWKRDGRKLLSSASTALVNGTIRVDGQVADRTYEPTVGEFHLYTFIPTMGVCATDFAHTFYGGTERHTGGARYGEVLFYKGETHSASDQAKIEAYLMKKWFDQGYGPACDLGALALTGETMQYADAGGSCAYVLSALSGYGTLDVGANAVSDVAALSPTGGLTVEAGAVSLADPLALNVAFTSPDAWGCVNVDGSVALPQQATVSVTVPNDVKPQAGLLYPILTATILTGDISNWTLNVSCAKRPDARLVLKPNGVYLEFIPPGMLLNIR